MVLILQKAEGIFFFLCLLFLPTQLGLHFWLPFSYIFSLPVDYLAPTVYFWDLLVLGLITCWLINTVFLKKRDTSINIVALNLLLLFLLTQSVSLANSLNFFAGLFRVEQLLVSGLFGLYIGSLGVKNLKVRLLAPLFIGMFFESLLAISQFLFGRSLGFWVLGERRFDITTPVIAKFNWFNQILLRPYATFPHPNVLATYIILLFPFIQIIKSKRLKVLLSFFGVLTVIFSFSRVAIVLLVLYSLPYLLKRLKFFLFLLLLLGPLLFIRFSAIFNFDSLSFIRREELAEIAIKAFIEQPVVGIGLNSFINYVSISEVIAGPSRFLQPVHNIYLLLLVETGVVGFLGFVILCGVAVLGLVKNGHEFSRPLFFCWVVILFSGLFDHFFLTLPQGQRMMFFVWGLSMIHFRGGKTK